MVTGIAISGRAGAGKTALAKLLQERLGGPCRARICPIAQSLKDEVLILYGLSKCDPGGREKLIEHGEQRRLADPHYWIRPTAESVRVSIEDGRLPIIDDVRFPAELAWARGLGFCVVRVRAPVELRMQRLFEQGLDPAFAHSTEPGETALDSVSDWDVVVGNTCKAWLGLGANRVLDHCGLTEEVWV